MHHVFARCYCLYGGDFIRCCDNVINFKEISLFPEQGETRGKRVADSGRLFYLPDDGGIDHRGITEAEAYKAEPLCCALMRYVQAMIPTVGGK